MVSGFGIPAKRKKRSRIRKAGNGTRTRDNHLGKVELYQLSYSRVAIISRGNISSFSRVSISFFVVLSDVVGDLLTVIIAAT